MKKFKEVTTEQVRAMLNSRKDMTGLNLKGFNFSGETLENIDFSRSKLENVNFEGATIINCLFNEVEISGVSFEQSYISRTQFYGVMSNVNFSKANLSIVTFNHSKMSHVSFQYASMGRISFKDTLLGQNNFEGCDFYDEILFQGTHFTSSNKGLKSYSLVLDGSVVNYVPNIDKVYLELLLPHKKQLSYYGTLDGLKKYALLHFEIKELKVIYEYFNLIVTHPI